MSDSMVTNGSAPAAVATTGMLIRRPVREVFEAFVDPAITSTFWFTGGSGRLQPGATVQWEWAMYGFAVDVRVLAFEQDRRILIEWAVDTAPTTVEWVFESLSDGTTFVTVTNAGFTGTPEEIVRQVGDAAGGFSFTLAGLKAYLEHGIELNLVRDRFPHGLEGQDG